MYGLAHVLFPLAAVIFGHQDINAHGKAHKHINQQIDKGGSGTNCRKGAAAGKPAHHNDVRCIEQKL